MTLSLFCPAQIAMKSLRKKWMIEILFQLHLSIQTFGSLKTKLGISDKSLWCRLTDLSDIGLVSKLTTSKNQTQYQLTEKGVLINRVLHDLSLLGLAILDKESFNSQPIRRELSELFEQPDPDDLFLTTDVLY